ncbi:hypothetical protein EVAR_11257_1 [Eumeta japonica]|uniref:Secreted protein n=1 Tax=Eumeta variegata TaxID=151549 RepID=A0A4C1UKM7_EUMVA|nr:hypothetical protein EVAR_11257_1 [Eumeta japonica]
MLAWGSLALLTTVVIDVMATSRIHGLPDTSTRQIRVLTLPLLQHCPEAALVSARVLAAEGAPATRSASGVERRPSAPRPPLCKRGSGSMLQPAPQPK